MMAKNRYCACLINFPALCAFNAIGASKLICNTVHMRLPFILIV